jgi:hypothetical protein
MDSTDPSRPLTLYSVDWEPQGTHYARIAHGLSTLPHDEPHRSGEIVEEDSLDHVLCVAPCDQEVPVAPGKRFFLGGPGITPSSRFILDPNATSTTIKGTPGSLVRSTLGNVAIIVGATSLGLSTLVVIPIAVPAHSTTGTGVGVGLLGAGAALLGTGIYLVITGKTTYAISRQGAMLQF